MSTVIRSIDMLAPALAAGLTYPAYLGLGRRRPVHAREQATHDAARRESIIVAGRRVVVYEWGAGDRTVLVVHGWRGRAAQFAAIVRELRSEGYRVIGFDAPASGDSPGRRTHIGEFRAIVDALARREGGFHAIVTHSAGTLAAAAVAADDGITDRIVAIAPIVRVGYLSEQFARMTGLGGRAMRLQEAWFAAGLRRRGYVLDERYELLAREWPESLSITIVHDRGDRMSDIGESRRLAQHRPAQVALIETEGSGHIRVLESDAALDAVLDVVRREVLPHEIPATSRVPHETHMQNVGLVQESGSHADLAAEAATAAGAALSPAR
ncbi:MULTISPECIES: alpha/beta hydrolase [unclassified Microbacterium]|uniref:alpha/beta hydrolase n=1 Tax=unclassified Microbacterium TaxID=2609290 RepID=UPI0012FAA661|nr:alpha/beta fold hydrolase [Microbacterium sp. MAH-37]MVQ42812.1 alpha/beta fold hydrolase [Microbacterium sp. MAH-37]